MGPFGRAAVGLIVSKDVANKKKDGVGKEGNKSRKGIEDGIKARKGVEDTGFSCLKKDASERRNSSRLLSWSRDDCPGEAVAKESKVKPRRNSVPGKVENVAVIKMESSPFLDGDFGLASSSLASSLGLNRIKTRSGPLYSASTRSGPLFTGTLQSRFDAGKGGKREEKTALNGSVEPSSRSMSGVRKASKVHARDSVSPKDSAMAEARHDGEGRAAMESDLSDLCASRNTDGCLGSPFVGIPKMNVENGEQGSKGVSGSLSGSCVIVEDIMSPSGSDRKEISGRASQVDDLSNSSWVDVDSNFDCTSTGGQSMGGSPVVFAHSISLPVCIVTPQAGASMDPNSLRWRPNDGDFECSRSSDAAMQENESPSSPLDVPKETESPRFQALLRMTGGPRKSKLPNDIKSFSHELDPRGVRTHDFLRPHSFNDLEEVLEALRARFNTAKEEVNSELAVFAGDLIEILEKNSDEAPDWQERTEDLLVLARECALMGPQEFRKRCEGIVQELDDKRQELPMGVLKQLHTRMLFILTRCTRLLQFQKENGLDEDGPLHRLHQRAKVGPQFERHSNSLANQKGKSVVEIEPVKERKSSSPPHVHSEDAVSIGPGWRGKDEATTSADVVQTSKEEMKELPSKQDTQESINPVNSLVADRLASWKKFTSSSEGWERQSSNQDLIQSEADIKAKVHKTEGLHSDLEDRRAVAGPSKDTGPPTSLKRRQRVSWGNWGDQPGALDDNLPVICRICEEEVPTLHLEEHSRVCAFADRCDHKALSIDERLRRLAEVLEKMLESYTPKSSLMAAMGSPDTAKTSSSNNGGESSDGGLSEKFGGASEKPLVTEKFGGELLRRGSEEMLEDLHEIDTMASMVDEPRINPITCKTRFGPRPDQFMAPASSSAGSVLAPASSAGSITPRSPLATPRTSQIDLLLAERSSFGEAEDLVQINELADIARCIANTNAGDEGAPEYMISCMQDLQDVLQHNKVEALTVDTFGKRIDKLCREKLQQVCDTSDANVDTSSSAAEEDTPVEDDVFHSQKSTPVHPTYKDRTSIDDFEIIKPISRGAFGRVFLARKRTTGDFFAIKVLRKADMIRKNAVESVQAERNILISARNPFVVRFFYSFTCRENLYLVMEYLNGGDVYSMLRNLGCLEEEMTRVYIAELVLALEYLHSLGVVHRDVKPDNLLIAHDGHIKLTDFGLSRVGLINSTDDLSGPAVSGTMLMKEIAKNHQASPEPLQQRERRQQRPAVGTPDYLAPEILLGTSHGPAADWWSTGVILFECLTGIPPFNAEHPQLIFNNILNRNIPWPRVPEDMSYDAQDLIDRLLTEDPNERLGAKGAAEVKAHPFFKNINWDTLARQKAAFIPSPDSADDTSYFTSRHTWNSSEGRFISDPCYGDSSDYGSSSSGSTSSSDIRPEEGGDECRDMAEFETTPSVKYSFSNFSFKNLSQLASINYDLLLQTGKDSPKGSS